MFSLFGSKRSDTAVLLDISSTTIGGAFASFPKDGPPVVPYSIRIPIEFPDEERGELCMLRAFETLMNELHDKGLPAFARATGTHHPDRVFVSIGPPWQETKIETQIIADGKPFIFTREVLQNAIQKRNTLPTDRKELLRETVGTLLNGYRTDEPFGKKATRAEIILLSSSMDAETMSLIARSVKRFGASKGALLAPSQSLAHAVLHAQYPHEKDFLVIRVSDEATTIIFESRGIIMDVTSVPIGLSGLRPKEMVTLEVNKGAPEKKLEAGSSGGEGVWISGVTEVFREFATRHALPRIVYLLANEGSVESLKRFLDTPEIHSLWLSDEPLRVIPVVSRLLSSLIRHQGQSDPDVMLDLATLYAQIRFNEGK